jgi:hypothetical protein
MAFKEPPSYENGSGLYLALDIWKRQQNEELLLIQSNSTTVVRPVKVMNHVTESRKNRILSSHKFYRCVCNYSALKPSPRYALRESQVPNQGWRISVERLARHIFSTLEFLDPRLLRRCLLLDFILTLVFITLCVVCLFEQYYSVANSSSESQEKVQPGLLHGPCR